MFELAETQGLQGVMAKYTQCLSFVQNARNTVLVEWHISMSLYHMQQRYVALSQPTYVSWLQDAFLTYLLKARQLTCMLHVASLEDEDASYEVGSRQHESYANSKPGFLIYILVETENGIYLEELYGYMYIFINARNNGGLTET